MTSYFILQTSYIPNDDEESQFIAAHLKDDLSLPCAHSLGVDLQLTSMSSVAQQCVFDITGNGEERA